MTTFKMASWWRSALCEWFLVDNDVQLCVFLHHQVSVKLNFNLLVFSAILMTTHATKIYRVSVIYMYKEVICLTW